MSDYLYKERSYLLKQMILRRNTEWNLAEEKRLVNIIILAATVKTVLDAKVMKRKLKVRNSKK